MATYYVGPGGNDANDGLSWANRLETLNGAEDEPVASGDTVYVGPGIYREMLTCDVDGASEIANIADVTGIHTDGVGGDVIISGSDDDTTSDRIDCIQATGKSYRTFVGFHLVGFSARGIYLSGCDNIVIRDVCIDGGDASSTIGIYCSNSDQSISITRCIIVSNTDDGVYVYNTSDTEASSFTITDSLFIGNQNGIRAFNVDNIQITNCSLVGNYYGIVTVSLAASDSITVTNCIVAGGAYGMYAATSGDIASTYSMVTSDNNQNWSAGTGDVEAYVMNLQFPILYGTYAGIRYPVPLLGQLNPYAYAGAVTGSSETSTDLFGITKPTTASKSSWGAIQFQCHQRETTTTRGGSTASVRFEDAGEMQIWVPVDGSEITVSVYCYREANYAGTNPRLVIKEPGSADRTTTDAAAASQWNELTDTFTPSGDTDYVVVCLQSLNTAVAGDYEAFFDDLTVS